MQLIVEHIRCDNTTESGHDEVYMLLAGAAFDLKDNPVSMKLNGVMTDTTNGFSFRVPAAPQGADADPNGPGGSFTAWDSNDSGNMQDKALNAVVLSAELPADVKFTLSISVMESDNWDYLQAATAAAKIGTTVYAYASSPTTAPATQAQADKLITAVSGDLNDSGISFKNVDDHLGQVVYYIQAENGTGVITSRDWGSGAVSWGESGPGETPYTNKVHFKGDGSDYKIDFRGEGMTRNP
jgi:hypothetical protein